LSDSGIITVQSACEAADQLLLQIRRSEADLHTASDQATTDLSDRGQRSTPAVNDT